MAAARDAKAGGPQALEAFRADALAFFARVPEPPVYRRRDDPVRRQCRELLPEAEALLGRGYALEGEAGLSPWRDAVEAHLDALCLVADGRVEAAEERWHHAQVCERAATAAQRLWSRTDEEAPPVFRRATGESRYDPRPEPAIQVKLACPTCRKASDFSFSPRHATHHFTCLHCTAGFAAYFGEVRSVEVRRVGRSRRYTFRVEELGGTPTRVDVDDAGKGELVAARRDLIAFLYAPPTLLRGVLNLNTSRVLWLTPGGMCFVATVAFGEDAPELDVLRAFRDEVLVESAAGRRFVAWYYRRGPALARLVRARPLLRRAVREALEAVTAALARLRRPRR